jgi:hypothetical protein
MVPCSPLALLAVITAPRQQHHGCQKGPNVLGIVARPRFMRSSRSRQCEQPWAIRLASVLSEGRHVRPAVALAWRHLHISQQD